MEFSKTVTTRFGSEQDRSHLSSVHKAVVFLANSATMQKLSMFICRPASGPGQVFSLFIRFLQNQREKTRPVGQFFEECTVLHITGHPASRVPPTN
jgi:hypothetical protein